MVLKVRFETKEDIMKIGKLIAAVSGAIFACAASVTMLASAVTLLPKEESQKLDYTTVKQQYDAGASARKTSFASISSKKDMPVVHITTQDKKSITSKEYYVESVVDVFNCDEKYSLSAVGGVKVRGNSTAKGSEKPYRIKFDKKQNMLGLHDGEKYKSWVLLRSFWNLCPDYTAFTVAKALFEGEYYSSDACYVNLYINGSSKGIYLLCEQNQAGKGRAEVYEPDENEYQNEIGYFMEIDNYAGDDPYFTLNYSNNSLTDILGVTRQIPKDDFSIKSDINTQEQLNFIRKYMEGAYRILYESTSNNTPMMFDSKYNVVSAKGIYTPRQAVEAVFDCESVANMLLLEELAHDYDVGAGSFYMAVDFSEGSIYPKLTFFAPWDFNWAYDGSTSGYYAGTWQELQYDKWDRSNVWLISFMNADWFRTLAAEKWQRLSKAGEITKALNKVSSDIEALRNDLGSREAYRIDNGKNVVNYVKGRAKWLDNNTPTWNITTINANNVTIANAGIKYTGSAIEPKIRVRVNGKLLTAGTDYTVTYKNNINAGKGTATVTGIGNYSGTVNKYFVIARVPITGAEVKLARNSYTYKGHYILPKFTVTKNGKPLIRNRDYIVSTIDTANVGTGKLVVSGTGNYYGSVFTEFTIKKQTISSNSIIPTIQYGSYTYTGKEITPKVRLRNDDNTYYPASDYTVTYSNNVKVGKAVITLTGTGTNLTGSVTKTFYITPAVNTVKSLSSDTAGSFKVTWEKGTPGTTGYEVIYSTDSSFKTKQSYVTANVNTTSAVINSGVKSGQTVYVKVRAFYTTSGTEKGLKYGNYSSASSVKIK